MVREIRLELDEDQHEQLSQIKERRGLTWKGLMLNGAEAVEDTNFTRERFEGLNYDPDQDIRVHPNPDVSPEEDDESRLRSFKAGWTKAEKGEEFTSDTLEKLSWHNLGWRLGMLSNGASGELKRDLYLWCVRQQHEANSE